MKEKQKNTMNGMKKICKKENIEENTKGTRCKGNAQKKMAGVC